MNNIAYGTARKANSKSVKMTQKPKDERHAEQKGEGEQASDFSGDRATNGQSQRKP